MDSGMDPAIVADIARRLEAVEVESEVVIPLAVESGSRAWGFPSPDSDYDCRFIFVRRLPDYLSLFPPRDVIETPLTPVLDVNGWDLAKALKLMLKGNAVVIEWLTSPFAYRIDEEFRGALLELAGQVTPRGGVARHYHHLALAQARELTRPEGGVRLKKLFYLLRPLVALRWLERHPGRAVAPMHLPTLCAGADLPSALMVEIEALLLRKRQTRELGVGPVPPLMRRFIDSALAQSPHMTGDAALPREAAVRAADAVFRRFAVREDAQ